jgi:hypothetical protein
MVPGSTFRYGSSFCMVTFRPREVSRRPSEEAVRPLPSDEATPPVTKMCLVCWLSVTDPAKASPAALAAADWPPLHGISL